MAATSEAVLLDRRFSMLVLALLLAAATILVALVLLGWVPDTREPGRLWYPAAGNLDPDDVIIKRDCGT
jgi:hypothetical protein